MLLIPSLDCELKGVDPCHDVLSHLSALSAGLMRAMACVDLITACLQWLTISWAWFEVLLVLRRKHPVC